MSYMYPVVVYCRHSRGLSCPKSTEKTIEKSLNEIKGRTGYQVGNFIGGGIRDSIKDYNAAKAVYADNVAKGVGEKAPRKSPLLAV